MVKQYLLPALFFLFWGHIQAQNASAAVVHLGSERGMYWGYFSPYFGAEYRYNFFPGLHAGAGLGYVNDRLKVNASNASEFHRLKSIQPYANLTYTFPVNNRQQLSAGMGFKLIMLRLNYVEEIVVSSAFTDERTVNRTDYQANQPAAIFSVQYDYLFTDKFFAGLSLQHDYLLQREDMQPLKTSYIETGGFGTITSSSESEAQSLWRFTLRLGYKF